MPGNLRMESGFKGAGNPTEGTYFQGRFRRGESTCESTLKVRGESTLKVL